MAEKLEQAATWDAEADSDQNFQRQKLRCSLMKMNVQTYFCAGGDELFWKTEMNEEQVD